MCQGLEIVLVSALAGLCLAVAALVVVVAIREWRGPSAVQQSENEKGHVDARHAP